MTKTLSLWFFVNSQMFVVVLSKLFGWATSSTCSIDDSEHFALVTFTMSVDIGKFSFTTGISLFSWCSPGVTFESFIRWIWAWNSLQKRAQKSRRWSWSNWVCKSSCFFHDGGLAYSVFKRILGFAYLQFVVVGVEHLFTRQSPQLVLPNNKSICHRPRFAFK